MTTSVKDSMFIHKTTFIFANIIAHKSNNIILCKIYPIRSAYK